MDIVTANRNSGNLSLIKNNGDGTFAAPISLPTSGNGESGLAAADINRDGIMDLYVGANRSDEMSVLLGDGNGGLAESQTIPAGGSPWMIAAGDINGDGYPDVVSANSSNATVGVMLADGSGGLNPVTTYPSGSGFPLAIDLGDLDGDGDLDMMVSNYSGTWRLFENNGDGTFEVSADFPASAAASCVVFHDRDNDGDLDVTGIDELDDLLFIFDNPATGISERSIQPKGFALAQNYPNPFNPATKIAFTLAEPQSVTLSVYDIRGRKVVDLLDQPLQSGNHEITWNGENHLGKAVASGIYYYRLFGKGFSQSRKMVLLR